MTKLDIKTDKFVQWAKGLEEPEWMTELRIKAFELARSLPYPYAGLVDPSTIKPAGEYVGPCFPISLTGNVENSAIISVESHGLSRCFVREELIKSHVIITDIKTAIRKCAHIVKDLMVVELENMHVALSTAYLNNGIFIYIPRGCQIQLPISAIYDAGSLYSGLFNIIVVGENASATFFEERISIGETLNLGSTQIILKENSRLNLILQERWSIRMKSISTEQARIQKGARLDWTYCNLGSASSDVTLAADFIGPDSTVNLSSLVVLSASQRSEITTRFNHSSSKTSSNILLNGICKEDSNALFQSRIFVPKEAKEVSIGISNKVLLGKNARSEYIPELAIEANDVECEQESIKTEFEDRLTAGLMEDIMKHIQENSVRDNVRKAIGVRL